MNPQLTTRFKFVRERLQDRIREVRRRKQRYPTAFPHDQIIHETRLALNWVKWALREHKN